MVAKMLDNETHHYIKIGDTSVKARVWIAYDFDSDPLHDSFDFGNIKLNQEYVKRFESGELVNVNIVVNASWQDACASDSLCGSHLESKDLEQGVMRTVQDHGMVMEALKELQKVIVARARLYKFEGI